MPIFNVEEAGEILEELVERAKRGEEILIRDGFDFVQLKPVIEDFATTNRGLQKVRAGEP